MKTNTLSSFGMAVKVAMLERGMKQVELIELVKQDTGLFVDDSYMYKILRGERNPKVLIGSIKKILELKEDGTNE
jgi:hypothetical protein